MADNADKEDAGATLLVSEFPPPPWYYQYVSSVASSGTTTSLPPPTIPQEALANGTRRTAAAAARARELAEQQQQQQSFQNQQQQQLQQQQSEKQPQTQEQSSTKSEHDPHSDPPGKSGSTRMEVDKTDAILGGVVPGAEIDEEGDVVAIFGEIVEDPLLVQPVDTCDDPQIVKENVHRINGIVLQYFIKLVQDLVHQPSENKMTRDELSHNIFLMLQECNKFREHQAREILIELLEQQLQHRKVLIQELREFIERVDQEFNDDGNDPNVIIPE